MIVKRQSIIKLVVIGFIIPFFLRIFVFEIYKVKGRSMEGTLLQGDYILVSKIHYGARIPISHLIETITNIFHQNESEKIIQNSQSGLEAKWNKRFLGFSSVNAGDIVVFNTPIYQNHVAVKRCRKKTGDTLEMFNKNGFAMTDYFCQPKSNRVIVPGNGKLIYNVRIIDIYTEKQVSPQNLKSNYYYLLGDNPSKSTDSRNYGLVKEDHIIGKAIFVIFSVSETKTTGARIRLNRFFKAL